MSSNPFFVYIVSSHKGTLYTGMTRDIANRIDQHKSGRGGAFSSKYKTANLVYCELVESFDSAREREAQIKRWNRRKKVWLIEMENPYWRDLSASIDF
ncbi:MAG: GIY-YIG nuclease family protein [Dehalococcoidia bacterium]